MDSGLLFPLPDAPSKELVSRKARCSDNSVDLNPNLAAAIISSLKAVINNRANILYKGIESLKTIQLANKVTELAHYERRWNLRFLWFIGPTRRKCETACVGCVKISGSCTCKQSRGSFPGLGKCRMQLMHENPRLVIVQFTMRHFSETVWTATENSSFLSSNHLCFAEDLSPDGVFSCIH